MNVENRDNKFLVITSDECMVLTEWTEEDIMEYSGTERQFSPINYDLSKLREITIEEHNSLMERQEEMEKYGK